MQRCQEPTQLAVGEGRQIAPERRSLVQILDPADSAIGVISQRPQGHGEFMFAGFVQRRPGSQACACIFRVLEECRDQGDRLIWLHSLILSKQGSGRQE